VNIWRDKTFGKTGIFVWIPGLSPVFLTAMFIMFASNLHRTADFVGFGAGLLLPATWGVFYISQVLGVFQEICLDGDQIIGKLYFGRKLNLKASEVKSFSYYPMTWKIRQINLFDRERPGINVELRSGGIIRINAKTENFPSLVDALKAFAQASGQIGCSL
jgi:hypothetical protein